MPDANRDTTVVITSCGRHDLLDRTLASFLAVNTYAGVREILVVEDGDGDPAEVCGRHGARLLRCGERLGQARAIDLAYAQVETPYIFHCEDDWEFYAPGFIEKSKAVLEADPSTVVVWLRAWADTMGHPMSFQAEDRRFGVMAPGYLGSYHGFSFNPGLRRRCDYARLGAGFAALDPNREIGFAEAHAGAIYHQAGYRAVILDEAGYVRHIGEGRHIA